MTKLVLIAVMGGVGSTLRYLLSTTVHRHAPGAFPWGTFCVNILGCLCAGAAAAYFAGRLPIREDYRLAVTVGFLGGFTTFSAFAVETVDRYNNGERATAALYVASSVLLGLAAVWLGARLVTR